MSYQINSDRYVMEKACFICGVSQPIANFYTHPNTADGHLGKCKDCTKRGVRQARLANPERMRNYDRERSVQPKRAAAKNEYNRTYALLHPEKRRAQVLLRNAVRDGKIFRGKCVFCGHADEVVAHHHDYAKPLDVTWLCRPCHSRFHTLEAMATYRITRVEP